MKDDASDFRAQPRYPAVVYEDQVGFLLGLTTLEVKILVTRGKIDALGRNRRGTKKRFATAYILELADDLDWLGKAREAISQHWREKNAKRKARRKTNAEAK
jgi:hypothetical protein